MNWTREKPIREGFYWLRSLMESPQPIIIIKSNAGQLLVGFIHDKDFYSLNNLHDGYEFCGPLDIPK